MALNRIGLFEEYVKKVPAALTSTRIDAAVATSNQQATILADIKADLVAILQTNKDSVQNIKTLADSSYDAQISAIDQQILDVQAVT